MTRTLFCIFAFFGFCSTAALGASTDSTAKIDPSELRGVKIWVQVKDASTRQKYCDLFESHGMIVDCERAPDVDENEVFLKCPKLPDSTAAIIKHLLNNPDIDVYDWRTDPDYGPGYCDELDAISLEIMPSTIKPSEPAKTAAKQPASPTGPITIADLKGFKIWVQVKDAAVRQKYCDLFDNHGLIVDCESNNAHMTENALHLKCPKLLDGTVRVIKNLLQIPDLEIYDWKNDKEYGPGYCNELDAIDLEILAAPAG